MYWMYSLKERVKPTLSQILPETEQVVFPFTETGKRAKFGGVDQKFSFGQDMFVMTRTKLLDI